MSASRRLIRLAATTAIVVTALSVFPSSAVIAYSGLQTPRDETSDPCCFSIPFPGNFFNVTGGNGYDNDSIWSWSTDKMQLWYRADPYPSPTAECPVVHIPNIAEANGLVSFAAHHSAGGTGEANQTNESYSRNYWVNIPQGTYYTGDYLIQQSYGSGSYKWAIDVIEFHYNSDHLSCSY